MIEVMVSALLVAIIAVAMFNGFDAAGRATADERAHAQADALAQQDEDRLRGKQISQLSGLNETRTVTYNGTEYTITSKAHYVSDATSSESCSAEGESADYIQTSSEVGWRALKSRPKVVETGVIAPHIGGSLLVQVTNANGNGVAGMTVVETGPSPSTDKETATTGANGCVIFGSVEPGTYNVTTYQTGYVEKNGNSEPPASERSVTVTNGTTARKEFEFDLAGEQRVKFAGKAAAGTETGDTFVIFNTSMTKFRPFGTVETYNTALATPKTVFPFTSAYTVYAGSCEADDPAAVKSSNVDVTNIVPAGGPAESTVTVPPVNIAVWSGKNSSSPGKLIESAQVWVEDTGCKTVVRKTETNPSGALAHPGLPFGKFKLCVTGGGSGGKNGGTTGLAKNRKYTTTFTNETASGPSGTWTNGGNSGSPATANIYMESGAATSPGTLENASSCP